MLPTMSAHLGVERSEAKGLVGTARSSPQPPLAVARRARLEVVGADKAASDKALDKNSVCALRDHAEASAHCRTHRSLRGPSVGRSIASGVRRRHVPNAVCQCSCRRNAAVAGARPGRDSIRRGQRWIWFFRMADHHAAACSKRNSILWRHMLWSNTASLRATATSDFRAPIRSDKARPQMESWEGRVERRSMTLAAS